MRKNTINKIILPYLLSGIFILPFIVKSFHIYDVRCETETHQCAGDHASSSPKHDCKTCQICQFTLSYFTDPGLPSQNSLLLSFNIERVTTHKEKQYFSVIHSHYLRAPPQYNIQL
ncbi:hypothetical protein [Dysgonomonas sp.]|nr:hypothetical protein [Prevotella sp.]